MTRNIWGGACCLLLLCLLSLPIRAQENADEAQILDVLASMSLERKVAQMFMVNLYGAQLTEAGRDILTIWQPGAVVILGPNTDQPAGQVAQLVNSYQQTITEAGGLPLFVAVDQEGGFIQRLRDGFTTWPVPMLLAAADDPELAYRVGEAMAAELRAVGVNFVLAPVADLQTNLANPIIGRRSFGSDPEQVGRALSGLIRGLQDAGVMAAAKHFPGHGDTSEDSHTTLPILDHDFERLNSLELPPFYAAIEAEVGAVMAAHIWFRSYDPDEALPASLSPSLISGLLRQTLAYEGIAITDALDMDAIDTVYSPEQAAIRAILAGQDMVLIGANAGEQIQARAMQAVVDAVRSGQISEGRIDESVLRILRAKQRFGLLETPVPADGVVPLDDSAALIDEVFRAGVTLVKDESTLIPLSAGQTIGLIFPGTRYGIQRECIDLPGALRWLAISAYPDAAERASARALADSSDVIVVFTDNAYENAALAELVRALPPQKTVVMAINQPYDLLRFPQISTFVTTYSGLDPALPTLCDVLAGTLEARGRLSVNLEEVAQP